MLAVQDIFLDTPLVNAHTSATDILWAGGECKFVVAIFRKLRMRSSRLNASSVTL